MANLIIKSSADNLVLQGSDSSPAITVGATGTLTFAENLTLSGTANNVGTVTAGTIASSVTNNWASAVMYRKVGDRTASQYPLLGWEVADDNANEFYLGASASSLVSESSGFFTMEQTGYILIQVHANVESADNCVMKLEASTNGSTDIASGYTILCEARQDSDAAPQSGFMQALVKTTTTANNNKFFIRWDGGTAPFTFRGGSAGGASESTLFFLKLADL